LASECHIEPQASRLCMSLRGASYLSLCVAAEVFHTNTLLPPPEASILPSGENTTERTPSGCPPQARIVLPEATSHRRRHLSSPRSMKLLIPLPEASILPSGENARELITTKPSWPCSLMISLPVATSHTRMRLPTPEARVLPSGENATEWTKMGLLSGRVPALQLRISLPVPTSHRRIMIPP